MLLHQYQMSAELYSIDKKLINSKVLTNNHGELLKNKVTQGSMGFRDDPEGFVTCTYRPCGF